MTYRGTFRKGVIVLEGPVTLADGTAVEVRPLARAARRGARGASGTSKPRGSKKGNTSSRRGGSRQAESSVDRVAREQGVTRVVPFDELLGGWPRGEEADGFEDAVDA